MTNPRDRAPRNRGDFYRADDRRAGITGNVTQSDRTYDPNRYRDGAPENYDRNRDFNRTYDRDEQRYSRGRHDFGYGRYGVESGFLSGAEYGGYGRGSDFGSFDRGDDLIYGSPWGRGGEMSRTSDRIPDRAPDRDHTGRGPKGYLRSDDRIRDEVAHILEAHSEIDASEIEIDVKDGIISLRGTVYDRRQKWLAEDAIETVFGVRDIRNQLKASSGPSDQSSPQSSLSHGGSIGPSRSS